MAQVRVPHSDKASSHITSGLVVSGNTASPPSRRLFDLMKTEHKLVFTVDWPYIYTDNSMSYLILT